MSVVVPTIFSPRTEPVTLSIAERIVAMATSMACLAVMLTAVNLQPSPTGMGTHTQLGLQSCRFYQTTGLPCPSCGFTTSFAWFARGNLLASFYIQPMGAVLACLTVALFWMGLYEALTRRAVHRLILFVPARYYIVPLLAWALLAWAWKIYIHTRGIDGWH